MKRQAFLQHRQTGMTMTVQIDLPQRGRIAQVNSPSERSRVVAVLKKHFPNFAVLRIVNQPNGA